MKRNNNRILKQIVRNILVQIDAITNQNESKPNQYVPMIPYVWITDKEVHSMHEHQIQTIHLFVSTSCLEYFSLARCIQYIVGSSVVYCFFSYFVIVVDCYSSMHAMNSIYVKQLHTNVHNK